MHIPIAFTGSGFNGGGRIKELVSLIDVPPTLLDACDIIYPKPGKGIPYCLWSIKQKPGGKRIYMRKSATEKNGFVVYALKGGSMR